MGQKKSYTEEFKREALRLLESSNKPIAVIERELGLSAGLLHYWRKRFQVNATSNTLELSEIEQLKLDLREAKRELARVQMEREVESLDSVEEAVTNEVGEQAAEAENALLDEALAAIDETYIALEALDNEGVDGALEALARVTGQLEIILARDPELALAPVDTTVVTYDLYADLPTIEAAVEEVQSLIDDNDLQAARVLLNTLVSETVIQTYYIPLETYPDAIVEAVALIDDGDIEGGRAVLNTALNTLVVEETVIPLPVTRAEIALQEAEGLAENAERTEEEEQQLADLLTLAREELEIAELLGYANETDYQPLYDQLREIESLTEGGQSGGDFFGEINRLLSELRDNLGF
jgi:transposase-like protein